MTDIIQSDQQPTVSSREQASVTELIGGVKAIGPEPPGPAAAPRPGRSPSQLLWRKLRRNRTAMVGLYILAAMYESAVLAGFLAPYRYDNARHDLPFHQPMLTQIHLLDEQGRLSWPFVYGITT